MSTGRIYGFTRASLITFVAAVAFVGGLQAQTSRGTVTGLVTDPSTAALPNATTELKNTSTNVVRSVTGNGAGIYRFDAVEPGEYQLTVKATGFTSSETKPFSVAAAQNIQLDFQLKLGTQTTVVEVSAEGTKLQTDTPVRGGSIETQQITQLPISSRNPVSLALTLPGVSSMRFAVGGQASFSVNGARNRSNNFMIDGMENNDISVAGQAFQITNPDTIQEVSIQTTNFDSEFGRAGGAVVNVVTKSGTNKLHGTASWLLDVTNDDAITNTQSLDPAVIARGKPLPGTEDIWAGSIGGAIKKNRTFFFGGYQHDVVRSSGTATAAAPSAAGYATLATLFPSGANARVDLFRQVLGGTVATSQFANVALGVSPAGVDRGSAQFGTATVDYANLTFDKQGTIKIDHKISDKDILAGRYSEDRNPASPVSLNYPGFFTNQASRNRNAFISETHIFSPTITNEFHIGYNRIDVNFPNDATNPLGQTLPNYVIAGLPTANVNQLGVTASFPQGRLANNYTLQDTVSVVRGRHALRMGFDLLDQRARQFAPINFRGSVTYNASTGYTGFANFIDDFAGSSGGVAKVYGTNRYYPKLFRQSYFVEDRWRVSNDLTVSAGLRYENPGVPINSLAFPVYTGLFNINPVTLDGPFFKTNQKVQSDDNNFAPSIGLAWAPTSGTDLLGKLFGHKQFVVRAGYSIGYDAFYNNIASNAAVSSPNVNSSSTTSTVSTALPRGIASISTLIPPPSILTPNGTQNLVPYNLRTPYYQKWSFGVQRDLPGNSILDIAYVGTKGTKLYMTEDLNPLVPAALQILPSGFTLAQLPYNSGRYDPLQGSRATRTNGGSSYYHGLQSSFNHRFSHGMSGTVSYTFSKTIDYVSDPFSTTGINVLANSAVPTVFGGLTAEKGLSLIDRPHRFVVTSVYDLPIFRKSKGLVRTVLGGWQVSGVYTLESGVPYTVVNGFDADSIGGNNDRPNVNPGGIKGVRAVPNAASPTGYVNPDIIGSPSIDPATAQYVVIAANSGRTGNAGRNTERTKRTNNLNTNFFKSFRVKEGFNAEFRAEMYNLLNHTQYGTPSVSPFSPGAGTLSSNAATGLQGRFLNPTFMDGGGRVIRYQIKLVF